MRRTGPLPAALLFYHPLSFRRASSLRLALPYTFFRTIQTDDDRP